MNHRFAWLPIAALALVSAGDARVGAAPAYSAHDVDIVVDGAPQARYAHEGRWYIEALKGKEYTIRLHNPYGVRVAIALSVDGLNTIDARETTAREARKWVLDPYETITISGWQTSQTAARRFEFTTEERSYGQALGKTTNLGVISAVFFKERPRDVRSNEPEHIAGESTAPSASPAAQSAAGATANRKAADEYAATGMGRRTDHAVTQVWLDLEDTPAQSVNLRYEFRPQLVRLGILPQPRAVNTLERRERARGFEPGFCPEPR